jgi:ankyrin repeat protein
MDRLAAAVARGDANAARQELDRRPELKARLNEPHRLFAFDATPLLSAVWQRNLPLIEVLLEAGADINARSRWWAGGFGVLDGADSSLVPFLLERGAVVDAHAAARLGMVDKLEALLSADPQLVHSRGGDGQTPLHFASSVEVARLLLDHGADIDARDIDHESTPAQYMIKDRQDVARYLVSRGCHTDILLAAALGDIELVRRHLDRDRDSIRTSVSDRFFPKHDPRAGGTIYIWTLGALETPHTVARKFGHQDVVQLLLERSPASLRLAFACEIGDEPAIKTLLAAAPNIATELPDEDRVKLADVAQRNNTRAVRLMLDAGWPTMVKGQHGGTPLHWAAWHGNAEMVRALLQRHADLEVRSDEHDATPLHWAIHGSRHSWNCRTGDYVATVEALLDAGAQAPEVTPELDATDPVRDALRRRHRAP